MPPLPPFPFLRLKACKGIDQEMATLSIISQAKEIDATMTVGRYLLHAKTCMPKLTYLVFQQAD